MKDGDAQFDRHKEYKELYHFELQRRSDLTSSLSIPIGIVTIIAGAVFYIIDKSSYPFIGFGILKITLVSMSAVFLLVSIYLLIRSYFNYAYAYIPTAQQLEDWGISLSEHYKRTGCADPKSLADRDIKEFLTSKFAEHAHRNTINNDTKSMYLHNANLFIISSLIVVFFAGGIVIFESFSAPEKSYKVILVDPNKIGETTMDDDKELPPKEPPKELPKKEKPPPPPPDRIIKEEKRPPEKL